MNGTIEWYSFVAGIVFCITLAAIGVLCQQPTQHRREED